MKKYSEVGAKMHSMGEVRMKKGWAVSGAHTVEHFPGHKCMSDKKLRTVKHTKDSGSKFMGEGRMSGAHGTTAGKQEHHSNNKNSFGKSKAHNVLTEKTGGLKTRGHHEAE